MPSPLVATDWLASHPDDGNIHILDASWYLPQAKSDPKSEYEGAHIPGAVFFDIEALSDKQTNLPHMMLLPDAFAVEMAKLGIGDDNFVVFYDGAGIYSAPRALWMLKAMGHMNVAVLDGGLPKWQREGRPITAAPSLVRPARFTARPQAHLVRDFDAMMKNLTTKGEQVVDARSPTRFCGEEKEPRPGVRAGHIPCSANIYYAAVVDADGTMLPADCLRTLFAAHHVDLEEPIVTSCGSGITAAILSLALEIAGAKNTSLYDGSWTEWGGRADAPLSTGPRSQSI